MTEKSAAEPLPQIVRGSTKSEYWFEERCHITEWLNEPSDPAISIVRARVSAGVTTQWHCLQGITERYLVISGRGLVQVGSMPATALAPGDSVRIAPGVAQRIVNPGNDDLVFLAICMPRFTPAAYCRLPSITGAS